MFIRSNCTLGLAALLILGGLLPLAGALIAQYGYGLPPCHFCLLQRYPYLLVIACGLAMLLLPRFGLRWRFAIALGLCGLLTTGALGLIHTGIEQGFLAYHGGCVAAAGGTSLEEIRAAITGAPLVACDQPAALFLGLSMASWNSLYALALLVFIGAAYRCAWRDHAA